MVSAVSSSAQLETRRDPRQSQCHRDGAANTMGLHGPALLESSQRSRSEQQPSPQENWFILGHQDPGPVFQLRGCSALERGCSWQLWVRAEAVSALQHVVPALAGGCFGGRGTFWGGGSGSVLGGLGHVHPYVGCPWLVPVGPPSPSQHRAIGVGRD